MSTDSPIPNPKDDLIFGGEHYTRQELDSPDSEQQYTLEYEVHTNEEQATQATSLYIRLFKEMLIAVLNHESHLFSSQELDCFERFSKMSYNAKYLLIRLSLRRTDKWHRLDSLKYQSEMGNGSAIADAVSELCTSVLDVKLEVDQDTKVKAEPDSEVIDLTVDEEEDMKPKADPSSETLVDATEMQQQKTNEADLSVFCEDDTHMTLRELLECLTIDEIKTILRQMKLKTIGNRSALIYTLEHSAATQTTLTHLLSNSNCRSKSAKKDQSDIKPLRQTRLTFVPLKEQRAIKSQAERLREMVLQQLHKCVRINADVFKLFRRVNLVFFRNTQYSPTILTPSLLSRVQKRFYPIYAHTRTSNVWPSREALLAYEDALELEAEVDEILGGMQGAGIWRGRSRLVASKTPVPGSVSVGNLQTPATPGRQQTPGKVAMSSKENDDAGAGGEVGEGEEIESPRTADARAVKNIFESVYIRWKNLLDVKGEERSGPLERFDCGHILTRIVCKGAYALGILKEYEYEVEVLSSLLNQKRWRRGRRGRWHERRALILMTHFPKDRDMTARALDAVVEGLMDEDTHIIYRPMLERRLTRLEKRLKLPPDECHSNEGTLRNSEAVFVEGVRIRNRAASLMLDPSRRVVNHPETPVKPKGVLNLPGTTPGSASTVEVTPKSVEHVESTALKSNPPEVGFLKRRESWKGKSIWRGRDGDEVNVETFALQHYESQGYKGFHCEGRIVSTIFGLLFWDILFAPIPGAFETPYQSAPLDIAEDTFYHARKELIETRLKEIEAGKARSILECADTKHREKKTWCVGVRWDLFDRADLVEIVDCLGGQPLAVICRLFCEDYSGRGSGVPDLCIWNAERNECKFVEVKGPGDSLQENQKIWIDVLLRAGADVEICHVSEPGQSKVKLKLEKKAKTRKTSTKVKKKAPVAESDSEHEPMLESDDEHGELDLPSETQDTSSGRGVKRKSDALNELPSMAMAGSISSASIPSTSTPINRAEVVIVSPRKRPKVVAD